MTRLDMLLDRALGALPEHLRGRVVVFGSAPMVLAGLKHDVGDLDFFVSERTFEDLVEAGFPPDVNKLGFAKLGPVKEDWSERKLPLHPAALGALRAWLTEGWEEFVGRPPTPSDPLFPRQDGEFGRPDSAAELRKALELCELPTQVDGEDLIFHDARGCVATWLTNAHVEGALVRRFLGHAPQGPRGRAGQCVMMQVGAASRNRWPETAEHDAPEHASVSVGHIRAKPRQTFGVQIGLLRGAAEA